MDFPDELFGQDSHLPGPLPEDVLACCDMCGGKHLTMDCQLLLEAPRVCDSITSRARVTLPSMLGLRLHLDSTVSVTSTTQLQSGTLFGPMVAPRIDSIANHQFPLKVFGTSDGSDQFLDTSDEDQCNWMCLVSPSSEPHLQNLVCLQMGQDIYYLVRRAVPAGSELRVWYSPFYAQKLRHTLAVGVPGQPPPDVTEVVLIRERSPGHPAEAAPALPANTERQGPAAAAGPSRDCPLCEQIPAGEVASPLI
ncbi:PR domain zinc finger protein 15-like [Pollicipes pollicipes]|uniref:PR domain zinc finger protein 15-like n=1 Tax=Pollicipes pollicipes TaxID=41117 RepID=UPI0018856640|nr:PR domain zinc finger protein 15-like [Pollicipes pollicipes]